MKHSAAKFLILSVLMVVTSYCHASNETLTVALPNDGYSPFIILENTAVTGMLIEPLQLAAGSLGIGLKYVYYPEQRSRVMLDQKLIDARMESELWVDNPQDYLWTDSIITSEDVFVYHKKSESDFETDEKLAGALIITHLGYGYPTLQPLFDKGIIQRNDFSSELAMLNHLYRPMDGVNSAAVMSRYVATFIINSNPKFQNHFLLSKRRIGTAPLQFQFSQSGRLAVIVERLNTELKKLQSNHTVEQITDRILKQQSSALH